MSRELTTEEVRNALLDHIHWLVGYWGHGVGEQTMHERLEGLAFSILAALDGEAADLPGFIVDPCPHPSDRDYHQKEGTNWFPENKGLAGKVNADLGGSLHEFFLQRRRA